MVISENPEELSLSVFYVCRGRDSNSQPSSRKANALTDCATVAVVLLSVHDVFLFSQRWTTKNRHLGKNTQRLYRAIPKLLIENVLLSIYLKRCVTYTATRWRHGTWNGNPYFLFPFNILHILQHITSFNKNTHVFVIYIVFFPFYTQRCNFGGPKY